MSYNSELQKNNTALEAILKTVNELPDANSTPNEAVLYVPQTLTDGQKEQARENIGVGEEYRAGIVTSVMDEIDTRDFKDDIAAAVPIIKVPSEPLFAPNLETMTDTTKAYVNTETMTFWRYQEATYEATLTDIIESTEDNPVHEGYYVNKGSLTARAGNFVTPYINIGKYNGQIALKVKGATCLSDAATNYNRADLCDVNCAYLDRIYMCLANQTGAYVVTSLCDSLDKVTVDGDTTTFVIDLPRDFVGTKIHYIRFTCGKTDGTETWAKTEISVSYKTTVTGKTWVDSGISYTPNVTESDKQDIANEVANMIDSELISIIGDGEVIV